MSCRGLRIAPDPQYVAETIIINTSLGAKPREFYNSKVAIDFMEIKRAHYKSVDVNKDTAPGSAEVECQELLAEAGRFETSDDGDVHFPQVFIDGCNVGNAMRLQELEDNGMLTYMLWRTACPNCFAGRDEEDDFCPECGQEFIVLMPGTQTMEDAILYGEPGKDTVAYLGPGDLPPYEEPSQDSFDAAVAAATTAAALATLASIENPDDIGMPPEMLNEFDGDDIDKEPEELQRRVSDISGAARAVTAAAIAAGLANLAKIKPQPTVAMQKRFSQPPKTYSKPLKRSQKLHNVCDRLILSCLTCCAWLGDRKDRLLDKLRRQKRSPHMSTDPELRKFWREADKRMTPLTKEQAEGFVGVDAVAAAEAKRCDCELPAGCEEPPFCGFMHHNKTGDVFSTCPMRRCFHITWAGKRPLANPADLFDSSKTSPLGSEEVDRFTTPACLLKKFGYGFSRKFSDVLGIRSRQLTDAFPTDSFRFPDALKIPSRPILEYDVYVSYRALTGRFWLWITLTQWFNIGAALLTLVIIMPISVLTMHWIFPEPIYIFGSAWFSKSTFNNFARTVTAGQLNQLCTRCERNGDVFSSIFPSERAWFVFVPYGCIILVILCWRFHPWATRLCKFPRVWFDRFCIHPDNTELITAGLYRVPMYLQRSRVLLCIFDRDFSSRVWSVFEVQVYLKVRKNAELLFVHPAQRAHGLIIGSWRLLFVAAICIMNRLQAGTNNPKASPAYLWLSVFQTFAHRTITFFLGQKWFMDQIALRESLKSYDVREAELENETDRIVIFQYINYWWGTQERAPPQAIEDEDSLDEQDPERGIHSSKNNPRKPAEVALDRYNDSVRNDLPRLMPLKGPRAWYLFGYGAAVIFMSPFALYEYDAWAYQTRFDDELYLGRGYGRSEAFYKSITSSPQYTLKMYFSNWKMGLTSLLSLSLNLFVFCPMILYLMSALLRLLLKLQRLSKLPYYASAAFGLTIFLFLECIVDWRWNLLINLQNLASLAVDSKNIHFVSSSFVNSHGGQLQPTDENPFPGNYFATEGTRFGLGKVIFDPDAGWKDIQYVFTFRPFWGIYMLVQYYSGACQIEHAWRPNKENLHRTTCAHVDPWTDDNGEEHRYQYTHPGHDGEDDSLTHWNTNWKLAFRMTRVGSVFIWLLLILPLAFACYYIYETPWMRRQRIWFCGKLRRIVKKDRPADHDDDDDDDDDDGGDMMAARESLLHDEEAIAVRSDEDIIASVRSGGSSITVRSGASNSSRPIGGGGSNSSHSISEQIIAAVRSGASISSIEEQIVGVRSGGSSSSHSIGVRSGGSQPSHLSSQSIGVRSGLSHLSGSQPSHLTRSSGSIGVRSRGSQSSHLPVTNDDITDDNITSP